MYGQMLTGFAPLALVAPLAIHASTGHGPQIGVAAATVLGAIAAGAAALAARWRRVQNQRLVPLPIKVVKR